jgi:hypothetical protein
VHKHINAAFVRHDETISFLSIIKLDGATLAHHQTSLTTNIANGAARGELTLIVDWGTRRTSGWVRGAEGLHAHVNVIQT